MEQLHFHVSTHEFRGSTIPFLVTLLGLDHTLFLVISDAIYVEKIGRIKIDNIL